MTEDDKPDALPSIAEEAMLQAPPITDNPDATEQPEMRFHGLAWVGQQIYVYLKKRNKP